MSTGRPSKVRERSGDILSWGTGGVNWAIMIMAPGAFFMLAIFIWIVKGHILVEKTAEST